MFDSDNSRNTFDLSHFVFDCGEIGRIKTLSHTNVLPGDSISIDALGSLRLSPLRRGLSIDSKVDVCTFYVPYRHIFGDDWIDFIKKGSSAVLSSVTENCGVHDNSSRSNYLGFNNGGNGKVPKWLSRSYLNIFNNYYKVPTDKDLTQTPDTFTDKQAHFGLAACHLESIWSAPLAYDTPDSRSMSVAGDSLDIMKLKTEFAALNTQQERDLFMSRYRDIIDDFGGYVNTDADNRPTLLMRTEFWASGYDVDGTAQSTMGQFSGRVQQSWRHSVPKFFVPEHGVIMTLALVRFPPIHNYERPWLTNFDTLSYYELAGDSDIVSNMPPVSVPIKDIITNGSASNRFKMAYAQWYRYCPNYVNYRYAELEGYPFIEKPIICNQSADWTSQAYVEPQYYDSMFETMQLAHWNIQSRFNVNVERFLPTTRTSVMTTS